MFETLYIALAIFLAYSISIAVIYWIVERRANSLVDKIKTEYEVKKKKSNDIARNVLRGQLLEQFVPHRAADLEGLNPFDFRFIGDFSDYIVVDGYTAVKDGVSDEVKRVLFLEVKSGDAKPSKHQEAVIEAIKAGRVEYKVIQVPGKTEEW